ncbi:MAG: nucleotidyltransferase family protein [Gammaproteobacteria bacterium]|nr:nucleotidyltransferase family protein [Gammaproteobacteria bacterium]
MKAIILAGGFGTRLHKHVPDVPKPMAPIAKRPFLEYLLDRLVSAGIDEIILSVGYRAEMIIQHFGNKYQNIPISYAIESEPLGTGGAIAHALKKNNDKPIIVLNGDTLLDINFSELISWYIKKPTQVAMVLRNISDVSRYGSVLLTDDQIVGFVEKKKEGAGWINAGIYIIQPTIFKKLGLSGRFSFEAEVLQTHCTTLSPRAFLTSAYFIDIGIPDDYDRAQIELPKLA